MSSVERRKVQKTGSSSYIVTLPKDWIDAMGLKSGDYVYIYEHGGRLVITPGTFEAVQLQGSIKVIADTRIEEVFRAIVALYLSGYTNITVSFEPTLKNLAKKLSDLKSMVRIKLAGVEVVDETFNSVSFKILLDLKELPLENAIRRLHLIVSNMVKDSLESYKNADKSLAEAVIQRDDEADRFHFMIIRELSMALLDVKVMHDLGLTSPVEAINYRIVARNLERIADHSVNISKNVIKYGVKSNLTNEIYDLGVSIAELLNNSMQALYKLSRQDAEEVISKTYDILSKIDEHVSKVISANIPETERAYHIMILDSLRRITRYSNGIAETSINIKAIKTPSIEIK
ncbi:PhoU domain-containing protein [Thermogladius sp. 4427co]|uniref:PhoU domain-containing protein n=1 Tax=Thermogladius sp. 4427co TaxID=3450718 RepID=UPI003F79C887